ncbi:hypothetical protein ABZ557_31395 [Streptomyces sp. NPDC019645]|uniref:hypothetical protein n=1 Tax=Streptomyces sp. NPDC019645 TaxID=3154786 RepID=UPI0033EE996D
MPQQPGLRPEHQASLTFVEMREQHRKLHGELCTALIRDSHTTPTIPEAGSNTLMICKPLVINEAIGIFAGNRTTPSTYSRK